LRRWDEGPFSIAWSTTISPLTFNVLLNGLDGGVADGTTKIAITPKYLLFPELSFQFQMFLPD
jgi:hypothetical protein